VPIQKITKEEILKKSIDVFRLKGYHNTSMQDLAEACGLMKGSFYHYFQSKEALMKELLVGVNTYLKVKIFSIAYDSSLQPKDKLEQMLKKMGRFLFEKDGGCIVGNTTLETSGLFYEFEPVLKNIFTEWIDAHKHIFEEAGKPSETALKLAQQSIMELEGAVMLTKLYGNRDLLIDAFNRTIQKLD
jgi:TetR/AcrR family transcriptional repressor of nem operon